MNLPVRTGRPVRVTSLTSTTPRPVEISTRRPARVATISYFSTERPVSTAISTRSPLTSVLLFRAEVAQQVKSLQRLVLHLVGLAYKVRQRHHRLGLSHLYRGRLRLPVGAPAS